MPAAKKPTGVNRRAFQPKQIAAVLDGIAAREA